jgi:hypothetical protein
VPWLSLLEQAKAAPTNAAANVTAKPNRMSVFIAMASSSNDSNSFGSRWESWGDTRVLLAGVFD